MIHDIVCCMLGELCHVLGDSLACQVVCADVHVGLVSLVCLSNFYVICVSACVLDEFRVSVQL